jgi:membrane protein YdbS with pleckstrin-like domain
MPPDPERRLATGALWAWVVSGFGWVLLAAVLWTSVGRRAGDRVAMLLAVAVLLLALLAVVVVPLVRYRSWRYAVREEEIDLRSGVWVVRRTLVPMARVQHVETARTLLDRIFVIATLTVHTAAGKHQIPGLEAPVADFLRTEIARRARVPEDV